MYHAMAAEGRIRLEDAVRGRVITSGVHGIGASLVQRRGEAHIACGPAGDGDIISHGDGVFVFLSPPFLRGKFGSELEKSGFQTRAQETSGTWELTRGSRGTGQAILAFPGHSVSLSTCG